MEDFYNNGFLNLYNGWRNAPGMRQNEYLKDFNSKFGLDIQSRFTGQELRNKDEGLAVSMGGFKLTKTPLPGIKGVSRFDPTKPYDDPFLAARQANSTTYAQLMISGDQEGMDQAAEEFNESAEYTRTAACALREKETVEFSDLCDIFSSINGKLRANEADAGRIRVNPIGTDSLIGIDQVAIPTDLYVTLNQVADYMNEIKKTEDTDLQRSQAVQLAAYTYQLMISEHVFGNGNGRSCRLLADTILQTFGLPPQVPTFAMSNLGATIGNPLDFEAGTRCFMRGVTLATDLTHLKENAHIENLESKARAYLEVEHLNPVILTATSPSNAVNLAVQSGESRYGLATYLDDFVKANHFWSRNSKQYDALIETAKKTLQVLSDEPIYSRKSSKALEKLDQAVKEYEEHCKRHPKNDKTRQSRLQAVKWIKAASINIKNVGVLVSEMEGIPFKEELRETNDKIAELFTDDKLRAVAEQGKAPAQNGEALSEDRRLLSKYILTKTIIRELNKNIQMINFEEAKTYSEDERQIAYIADGVALDKAIDTLLQDSTLAGKPMTEKLDKLAENYLQIKTRELAEANKQNEPIAPAAGKQAKRKTNAKEAPALEEKSILSYMKQP